MDIIGFIVTGIFVLLVAVALVITFVKKKPKDGE